MACRGLAVGCHRTSCGAGMAGRGQNATLGGLGGPGTHWTLGLHANNLLDQVHVMDSGWGRAGRVVGLTLRVEH